MKVQFITIFVIALLALASYTQAQTCKVCKFIQTKQIISLFNNKIVHINDVATSLVLRGNFRHQTGDGMNSGCFGLDETDPTKTILVGRAVTSWTLFSGINCARGSEIASGVAGRRFNPPVMASSVRITC